MRTFRLLLLAAGGLAAVLAVLLALAFSSPVQTWVVRRALVGQPDLAAKVGKVSAGLNRVELREVEWRRGGVWLRVPLLEAELPLLPALVSDRLAVTSLRARGWVLEAAAVPPVDGRTIAEQRGTLAAGDPPAILPLAGGLLGRLAIPFDLSLDGVELEGEVRLPEGQGRVLVRAAGGGLASGRAGRFELASDAILVAPELNAVVSRAILTARMDGARAVSQIELEFQSSARGTRFPAGLELSGTLGAERGPKGETYTARAKSHGRTLLSLQAEYPLDSGRWQGEWKADFTEADLSALALGLRTPAFAASGGGTFEWAPAQKELQAKGQLAGTVDRLGSLLPELAAVERLTVSADFDVGGRDDVVAVRRLDASIAGMEPVASVRVLQPFAFHWLRREVSAADPAGELVGITLRAVPVAWFAGGLPPYSIKGDAVRGELLVRPRGRGVTVHSSTPLTLNALVVKRGEDLLVEGTDVEFGGALDLAPEGWALEVAHLSVAAGGRKMLGAVAKAGRLAGAGEALKLNGTFTASLPAWQSLPVLRGYSALVEGECAGEVSASLGGTASWHVKGALQNLATGASPAAFRLPSVSIDLRADVGANGGTEYHFPIVVQQGERRSDLLVEGKARVIEGRIEAIQATATSGRLYLEDVQAFGVALSGAAAPNLPAPDSGLSERRKAPPWTGWAGAIDLRFGEVIHGGVFRLSNVTGKAVLEADRVRLEGLDAGLGQSGRARVRGALMYDVERTLPYGFVVDVDVKDFDPGRILEGAGASREPVFEGRLDVSGSLAGRASSFERLPAGAAGAWNLASKGGVFRGLPVTVKVSTGSPGRVAGFLAAAGQAIGGLARRRAGAAVANRAEAVAEFTAALNPIAFDQMSLRLVHDAGLRLSLTDFTLIAPEFRLSGSGTLVRAQDSPLAEGALAMEYRLRARGRQGELLKYLGALDAAEDDLGYAACTLPIRVGGTLARPDASDLTVRLEALALEKGSVTERASDLFNRLIGVGK